MHIDTAPPTHTHTHYTLIPPPPHTHTLILPPHTHTHTHTHTHWYCPHTHTHTHTHTHIDTAPTHTLHTDTSPHTLHRATLHSGMTVSRPACVAACLWNWPWGGVLTWKRRAYEGEVWALERSPVRTPHPQGTYSWTKHSSISRRHSLLTLFRVGSSCWVVSGRVWCHSHLSYSSMYVYDQVAMCSLCLITHL